MNTQIEPLRAAPEASCPPDKSGFTAAASNTGSPDDFGFFICLPLAIAGGLFLWGCIAAAWVALV